MFKWYIMEHTEEMTPNEVAVRSELKRKDCDLPMKPAGCHMLESPASGVAAGSECPQSSTNTYMDILDGDNIKRCGMALAVLEPPCTSPNYIGPMDEELMTSNSKISNLALVSSSRTTERCRQGQWQHWYQLASGPRSRNPYRDFGSMGKDLMLLSSREDVRQMPFGLQDLQLLTSKQESRDLDGMSVHLTDSCNKILSSSALPIGDKWSKILSSSSFSQFFSKQPLKGKGVLSKSPKAHTEFGVSAMGQNRDKHAFINSAPSSALLNSSAKIDQPSQHIFEGDCVELVHGGISLREWLKPGCCEINKAGRLKLFRQIVQLVDFAHSQGVVLQELWPSCFILMPSNRVKYSGSSAQKELLSAMNQGTERKRPLEREMHGHSKLGLKQQKLGEDMKLTGHLPQFTSRCYISNEDVNQMDTSDDFNYSECKARNSSSYQCTSIQPKLAKQQSDLVTVQLEKKWYTCPKEINERGQVSSNIYSLGVLLFELVCCFESWEMHSAAMSDLQHRILPPNFLAENPKEAGFCLWLLHPEPSSRPTTREILQSELIHGIEELYSGDDLSSCGGKDDDAESELLLHFLISLKEQRQKNALKLQENIKWLEADIKEVERRHILSTLDWMDNASPNARIQGPHLKDHTNAGIFPRSLCALNLPEPRLMRNINQLKNAYFCMRSQIQLMEAASMERSDKDLLRHRDKWSQVQIENEEPKIEGKSMDRLESFFEGICKFARYSKFEVRGTLRNGNLPNSANVICSLSLDREQEYIAAAGVSKKIKIFEFGSLLNDSVDIHYPVVEMSNKSKLSCVCWNNYIKNYLASTDYDGVVQMWDASTGQGFSQYVEHQRRAWSVDFSQIDPTKFASGSDDCSVKLWSINEKNSTGTIGNPANVCCVQFSAYSSHILAFGSADYKIYCYDLRHTRVPWCTLPGHGKAVSYVKFLDKGNIVSASTDNTLKLWDLNKTSLEGFSSNACSLTFSGHTNEKNFVGLSVFDGYIACGSENNEVYAYHRSLPMPITSHKFGSIDPISGYEIDDSDGQFVSSVCWRGKSNMVVAANSSGSIKLLQMV